MLRRFFCTQSFFETCICKPNSREIKQLLDRNIPSVSEAKKIRKINIDAQDNIIRLINQPGNMEIVNQFLSAELRKRGLIDTWLFSYIMRKKN